MRCSTRRPSSRWPCTSPPTAVTCGSRCATAPPASRRPGSRSPMRPTGAACTSCARWPTRGASRCGATGPARRCGSRCPCTRRRRAASGGSPPTEPDRRRAGTCRRRRRQHRPVARDGGGEPATRRGPSKGCGWCSTGCATPSWPPTSRARSATSTSRPRTSWAGPAAPSSGRPVFDLVPDSLTAAVGDDYGAFVRSQANELRRAPRSTSTSSGPTAPTSAPSWSSASSTIRSPARWSSASSAPATRRSCSAGPS